MKNLYLILSLIFLSLTNIAAQTVRLEIPLNNNWRFREAGKGEWKPATVPGCVHTDLLANRLIEDPFYRDNENFDGPERENSNDRTIEFIDRTAQRKIIFQCPGRRIVKGTG